MATTARLLEDSALRTYLRRKAEKGKLSFSLSVAPEFLDDLHQGKDLAHSLNRYMYRIVVSEGRPSPIVSDGVPQLPPDGFWTDRIDAAEALLSASCPSVGKLEVLNDPGRVWLGTGWVADSDLIVTNQHVAERITKNGKLRRNANGEPLRVRIDFAETAHSDGTLAFDVVDVAYLAAQNQPDIAILRTAPGPNRAGDELPPKLALDAGTSDGEMVAVIGFPGPGGNRPDLAQAVFGDQYEVKRVSPGFITSLVEQVVGHDCSTGPGSSGSAIMDLQSGNIVGLHAQEGLFEKANYGVTAQAVLEVLSQL